MRFLVLFLLLATPLAAASWHIVEHRELRLAVPPGWVADDDPGLAPTWRSPATGSDPGPANPAARVAWIEGEYARAAVALARQEGLDGNLGREAYVDHTLALVERLNPQSRLLARRPRDLAGWTWTEFELVVVVGNQEFRQRHLVTLVPDLRGGGQRAWSVVASTAAGAWSGWAPTFEAVLERVELVPGR